MFCVLKSAFFCAVAYAVC